MKKMIVLVLALLMVIGSSTVRAQDPGPLPPPGGGGINPPLFDMMLCMMYNSQLAQARLTRSNLQGGINMLEIEKEMLGLDPTLSLEEYRLRVMAINAQINGLIDQIRALDLYIQMLLLLIDLLDGCPCTACDGDPIVGPPIPDPNFP